MRWSGVSSLGLAVLLLAPCANAQAPHYQAKVKIPYALQSGSKVIEPGEYSVEYKSVSGDRIMTVQDSKGDVLLRTTAQYTDQVPKEDRSFARGFRLRITRVADQKSPGKQWVVFDWDYVIRGNFFRVSFRVPEAAKAS
ncbi:MAG: hypothetical protein HY237_03195 [Acidobacteria bacterium]|nr:hypothetical protein [Acidobacteriota bacterium]